MKMLLRNFWTAKEGNFTAIAVFMMTPLILAGGMAVDFGSAIFEKTKMQGALDSATLSLTTLPKSATDNDRRSKLQKEYSANGGSGTTTLNFATFDADGTLHLSASATEAMKTNFMALMKVNSVNIGTSTKVTKYPSLISATFSISKVSGYWNKTVIVQGVAFGSTVAKPILQITYVYNGSGGTKGYGTTTVLTPDSSGKMTVVQQQQTCTSKNYNGSSTVKSPSFVDGSVVTTCTLTAGTSAGATIDVSGMNQLYLEMDVPSGTPSVLKSNDPSTSNRLYISGNEVASEH